MFSLDVVEHADCCHETATADRIVGGSVWHQVECSVIDCIELARPVRISNVFKQGFDLSSLPWLAELILRNTDLGVGGGEEEVDCLGLIAIVLEVCH